MSSYSLSLKMMLAATACAGLTLAACGDDSSSGGGDTKDAGKTNRDAGKDAGRKDAGLVPHTNPGDDCTGLGGMCDDDLCDSPPCYSQCVDGVSADCQSQSDIIGSVLKDGGLSDFLKDSGIKLPTYDASIAKTDAGYVIGVGDASVPLPTSACPSGYTCDSTLTQLTAQFTGGVGLPPACVKPKENTFIIVDLPPKCTTNDDCTKLGLKAACVDTMFAGSICAQPCQ